jgi:hypothetical protein
MTWTEAIASLPEDLRPVLMQLRVDYVAARDIHVPGLKGGPSVGILVELVRQGWRKSGPSN